MTTRFLWICGLTWGCNEYKFSSSEDVIAVDSGFDVGNGDGGVGDGGDGGDGGGGGDGGAATNEEYWSLPTEPAVDVVFFGDTSGSMTVELKTMGEKVTTFVDRLDDFTPDWQLLAVTGPDGCGVNGVLTPTTPDYAALFAAGVLTPPGEDKVDEWGLQNIAAAVEATDPGECNEGFLREGALLHAIFLSDEDDNSPGWEAGDPDYWRAYTELIEAKKGDPLLVRYSSVAGPLPKGCHGAEPGHGYVEATDASGGQFLSICEDWSSQVELLAEVTVAHRIFPLEHTPVPSTIRLYISAEERLDGWHYEAEPNEVWIDEDPPVSGQSVIIEYSIAD